MKNIFSLVILKFYRLFRNNNFFIFIFKIIFSFSFLFIILKAIKILKDKIEINSIEKILFSFYIYAFIFNLFFGGISLKDSRKLLILNIKKNSIIFYTLINSFFSLTNLIIIFIISYFTLIYVDSNKNYKYITINILVYYFIFIFISIIKLKLEKIIEIVFIIFAFAILLSICLSYQNIILFFVFFNNKASLVFLSIIILMIFIYYKILYKKIHIDN